MNHNNINAKNNSSSEGITCGEQTGAYSPRTLAIMGAIVLVAASRVPEALGVVDFSVRDHLPEPVDIPDHIGNMAPTAAIIWHFSHGYWNKKNQLETDENFEKRRKILALAAGVITVAANVFAETIGYGPASTPDTLDFAYGIAGGAIAYSVSKPKHFNSDVVHFIETTEFSDGTNQKLWQDELYNLRKQRGDKPIRKKSSSVDSEKDNMPSQESNVIEKTSSSKKHRKNKKTGSTRRHHKKKKK